MMGRVDAWWPTARHLLFSIRIPMRNQPIKPLPLLCLKLAIISRTSFKIFHFKNVHKFSKWLVESNRHSSSSTRENWKDWNGKTFFEPTYF